MNKTELISAAAEKAGMSKKDSEKLISAAVDTVVEALIKGEKVQIVGFGTFETKERAERTARNPRTKEEVVVPATRVASFKVGKALKDAVAK